MHRESPSYNNASLQRELNLILLNGYLDTAITYYGKIIKFFFSESSIDFIELIFHSLSLSLKNQKKKKKKKKTENHDQIM